MSAPPFSSFPPSFGSFPDLEPDASRQPSSSRQAEHSAPKKKHREDSRKDKHKKPRHAHEVKSSHRDSSKHHHDARHPDLMIDDERAKAEEDRQQMKSSGGSRGGRLEFSSSYFSDRKGDPLNVQYGGLHAGDVPKYHLVGSGRKILGLNNAWNVVHRGGKGIEVALGNARKLPQLSDSGTYALLTMAPTRRLLTSLRDRSKYQEVDGFLPLVPSRKGRQDDQSYRSIVFDHKSHSDTESSASQDSHAQSSDDDSDTIALTSREETLRSLEQQLTAHPSSIPTWFSLINHSLSNVPLSSKGGLKARSEITTSILSRALSSDSRNRRSASLRLTYLKAGEEIWHESKLRAEWEDALKLVEDVDVWMDWLDWRIRKGVGGVDTVVDDAVRALESIAKGLSQEDADIARLRVMWRIAVFFKEAGFIERGTALFQAQAELSFKVPETVSRLPFTKQLDSLEEFWEADISRVGELSSQGWHSWNGDPTSNPQLSRAHQESEQGHAIRDPYSRWALSESDGDRKFLIPLKTIEEDSSDPYATVLFSDIRSLLVSLNTAKGKDTLRLMWLSFLGLHIPGFAASLSSLSNDDRWTSAHLTEQHFFLSLFPSRPSARLNTVESYAGVTIGKEKEYRNSFGAVKEWGYGALEPLEGVAIDARGRMWEVFRGDAELIRRIFQQLRGSDEDTEWDVLALAFEAAVNIKSALKLSRTYLSASRLSIKLWTAHARLERSRGRADEARKIYETLLSSNSEDAVDLVHVWWDFAELEWLSSPSPRALDVVMRAARQQNAIGAIGILRAKRRLEEVVRKMHPVKWKEQHKWIKMRILMELIHGTMQGALDIADNSLREEKEGGIRHESLMLGFLLMIFHFTVTLRNPSPRVILRERVRKALEVYPSNTIILGLFLECERGEGVWGRVRGLMGETGEGKWKEKTIARRVAEVWIAGWEKGRWEGEMERVRAGLDGAVLSDRTRGSSILWRIYIEFEIRAGKLQRAKGLLFRALGECPLVKELYLLAFGPLRSVFAARELGTLAETMAERGLRMRTALDEILGDWREINDDSSGDEAVGDLERDAQELRRLMPY